MENKSGLEHYIFIDLDEHLARICDTGPGLHYLNCAGDMWLKKLYLETNSSEEDLQAWCDGEVTEHFQELLTDIGASDTDLQIEYCCKNRRYEIEVLDFMETNLSEPGFVLPEMNFYCL
jgi:hypothetical protein